MPIERQQEIALRALEDCLERVRELDFDSSDIVLTQLKLFIERLEKTCQESRDD